MRIMYLFGLESLYIISDFTLSMTASTPINVCGFAGTRATGIPPPPQAIVKVPGECSIRVLIASICKISIGGGEGTTRRKYCEGERRRS